MIKSILHILFLVVPFLISAQSKKETTWKKEKDYLEYKKTDKYEGPEDWYGSYPADMKSEDATNGGSSGYGSNRRMRVVSSAT